MPSFLLIDNVLQLQLNIVIKEELLVREQKFFFIQLQMQNVIQYEYKA
jgi:hypothetical protein